MLSSLDMEEEGEKIETEKSLFGIVPCIGSCSNMRVCCTLKFWKDLITSRLILIATYFVFCMYINCVSQVYVQHRAWEYFNHDLRNATVLPDIGFDILPHITDNAIGSMNWADFVTYLIMVSTLIRFIFGITREGHRLRHHILRRHIFALGTLFLLRAFAILSTLLPYDIFHSLYLYDPYIQTHTHTEIPSMDVKKHLVYQNQH